MMKNLSKILLILCFTVLLVGTVSSAEWDNAKSYDSSRGNYGSVNVENALGFGSTLATYTLDYNTDYCLTECEARGTTSLFTNGKLFSDMNFYNEYESPRSLDYKIYVLENQTWTESFDIYDESCSSRGKASMSGNASTMSCGTSRVNTITQEMHSYEWVEYDGSELDEGTYQWKIKATKDINQSIDWIGSALGVEFDEWAWWNASFNYKREIYAENEVGSYQAISPFNLTSVFNSSMDCWINVSYDGTNKSVGFIYYSNSASYAFADPTESYSIPFYCENSSAGRGLLNYSIENLFTNTTLTYWWDMNQKSVIDQTDLVNFTSATIVNASTTLYDVEGHIGYGKDFESSNPYGQNLKFTGYIQEVDGFSLEAWANYESGVNNIIIDNEDDTTLAFDNTGKPQVSIRTTGVSYACTSPFNVSSGVFHHIGMTYDGSDNLTLYVNGTPVCSDSNGNGDPLFNNPTSGIGIRGDYANHVQFDGIIDYVAVHKDVKPADYFLTMFNRLQSLSSESSEFAPTIEILNPVEGSTHTTNTLFTYNVSSQTHNISTTSLYIYNSSTLIYNETNSTGFIKSNDKYTLHETLTMPRSDNYIVTGVVNNIGGFSVRAVNVSFDAYVGANETFIINVNGYDGNLLEQKYCNIVQTNLSIDTIENPLIRSKESILDGDLNASYIFQVTDLSGNNNNQNATINFNWNVSNYSINLTPKTFKLYFTNSGEYNSTQWTLAHVDDVVNGSNWSIVMDQSQLPEGRVNVAFNMINATNWSQYYEFINTPTTNINKSLEILANPNWLVYFHILSAGGESIENAIIQAYYDPLETNVSYLEIGQRVTGDTGTTFFIFDENYPVKLLISAEGYEASTELIYIGDIDDKLDDNDAYRIILDYSSDVWYGALWVDGANKFYNRTENISFGVMSASSYDNLEYTTSYRTSTGLPRVYLEKNLLGYAPFTLVPNTDFNSAGTDDIVLYIFESGNLVYRKTIEYDVINNPIFDIAISANTYNFIILFALIFISGLVGMLLKNSSVGIITFTLGSFVATFLSTIFLYIAIIMVIYQVARIGKEVVSE